MTMLWVFGTISPVLGQPNESFGVAVLVSRNIRPYLEAVEGIHEILADSGRFKVRIFELENYVGKGEGRLSEILSKKDYHLVIGVGPEASRFMAEVSEDGLPMIYSMVLDPERSAVPAQCGVPLDIPPPVQLRIMAASLPSVRRIGLLFDPKFNSGFFRVSSLYAPGIGLQIVPLPVISKSEIPTILRKNWPKMDALWLIPDQTVISESIVQYVIKQALYKQRPVIGYNRFFYESGAALAFIFDYQELGRQTGLLAIEALAEGACKSQPPFFHTWLNRRVLDRLEMVAAELSGVEFGP